MCIRSNTPPDSRELFFDALGALHDDAAGRQLLSLFKTERLVPFAPAHIQTVVDLVDEHRRLEGSRAEAW